MKYLLIFLLFFPNVALSKKTILQKAEIIKAAETLHFVDEAFFHDALMDEKFGDQLGVYFKKKFLEEENKEFFRRYASSICSRIGNSTEFKGELFIYFYQRTLIRKYNEEGKARCFIAQDGKTFIDVRSRFDRYGESIIKWGFLTVGGTLKFLFADP
jgi:hypothetical protein